MATLEVELPLQYYGDPLQSRAIANGQVFVGETDLDPEILANRKTVTIVEEDGTEVPIDPAAQPLLTNAGGYVEYNGSPVRVQTEDAYSIKVLDSLGAQKFYVANFAGSAAGSTADIFSSALFYNNDVGSASNAYKVIPTVSPYPADYVDDMMIWFQPSDDGSTVGATLDVQGLTDFLGPIATKLSDGVTDTPADFFDTSTFYLFRYDETNDVMINHDAVSIAQEKLYTSLPTSYKEGFTVSNNATTTKLDIGAGSARDDSDAKDIVAAALTKTDATWAEGDDVGGVAPGVTLAGSDKWVTIWAVGDDDQSKADFVIDDNKAGTNVLTGAVAGAGFTVKQWTGVWWYWDDGAGEFVAAFDEGDRITWDVPVRDLAGGGASLSAQLHTLTAPPDDDLSAFVNISTAVSAGTQEEYFILYTATRQTDTAPEGVTPPIAYNYFMQRNNSDPTQSREAFTIALDTNSQIRSRWDNTTGGPTQTFVTLGYTRL